MSRITALAVFAALASLSVPAAAQPLAQLSAPDRFSWLWPAHDPTAVAWAAEQSRATMDRLTDTAAFTAIEREIRTAEAASAPKPGYFVLGKKIVRFDRDKDHPSGAFFVSARDGATRKPNGGWKLVLDVASLNRAEGANLEVMFLDLDKQCLPPAYDRCLIPFGAGGASLVQYREFDFASAQFVRGGFRTGPSRGSFGWLDEDTLLIAHASTPAEQLPSGFPSTVYMWKRGTPFSSARRILSAAPTDSVIDVMTVGAGAKQPAAITIAKDYATFELFLVDRTGASEKLDLPTSLQNFGAPFVAGRSLVVQLAQGATVEDRSYAADTLIAYDPEAPPGQRVSPVFTPADGSFVNDPFSGIVGVGGGLAFVETRNLRKTLVFAQPSSTGWTISRSISAPPGAAMTLASADAAGQDVVVDEAGFLTPTTISLVSKDGDQTGLYTARPIIDAAAYVSEIRSARSKDGVMVDYYLVRPRHSKKRALPIILYGYGGYGVNADPSYFSGGLGPSLVSWLSRGGGYAIAAVRGGSERGSAWAAAAKGIHRQRSNDDFAAVAEDMIHSGLTVPGELGCYGRSFGGLLAANMVTQRPDLFGAVLVGVPIVDLFRLGADGSDISAGQKIETGDWNDPKQVPAMLAYSPYQNIRAGVTYPRVLTVVSTQDGQVGPGHGRRFTAKLQSVGADAMLLEGPAGGHAFPSEFGNPKEFAAQISFFIETLMNKAR